MDPLSTTDPDTPCATLILSWSLRTKSTHMPVQSCPCPQQLISQLCWLAFLELFPQVCTKEALGITAAGFYGPDALHVTRPIASQHWMKMKAKTIATTHNMRQESKVPHKPHESGHNQGGSERADDPPSVGKRSAFAGERKYSSMQ